MNWNRIRLLAVVTVVVLVLGVTLATTAGAAPTVTDLQTLGENIYFDKNLSEPAGQACADCHLPKVGFDDPDETLPVSEGVVLGSFGGRNSPIAAYAMYSPIRFLDGSNGLWTGGLFWDSRASGLTLGDPLADQALGPFLADVEMSNSAKFEVVRDVALSAYAKLFQQVWGYTGKQMSAFAGATSDTPEIILAYDRVALSIAAYERTDTFGRFNSKYDDYLKSCLMAGGVESECAVGVGQAALAASAIFSTEEWNGLQLFMNENDNDGVLEEGEGAMCVACHVADWTTLASYTLPVVSPGWAPVGSVPPVFADHTYDNLGIPVNPEIATLMGEPPPQDLGLGAEIGDAENGKFRVVTLRNIGLSAPYGHNGYFKTLQEIVHFYNTRDLPDSSWATPEYEATVNMEELGNLGLTQTQEGDLVSFLMTLSDNYGKKGK